MSRWALRFYALLTWLAQPFLRRKLARRSLHEPGYSEAIEERFGRYTQPAEVTTELVWVHAVSLGETRTAAILLKALRARYPGLRLLLTHGTATGRAEGRALLWPGDIQVWQPWDSQAAVKRFFTHFKPRLGLLMETEIWPLTVAVAQLHAVPLVLVNGRLSEKSLQQALRMSPLSYPAYGALSKVLAQTDDDARRFRQLGVAPAGVLGNLKFDATPDAQQQATGKAWRAALGQPVVMFASSREGEEADFFKQIRALRQQNREQDAMNSGALAFKALVVPRHPQRFDEVQALAGQHGLSVSRRSAWAGSPAESADAVQADVWLGDSLGEMALYYAMSDVALLGGSFAPLGGQNLIEAAACACPVVMGPHTFNFLEAAELAEASGAALRAPDLQRGVEAALALVNDTAAQTAAASSGLAFADRNRGATTKTVAALAPFLRA
jgi:3-deoxy-D-manno-octulosonic-acid transferase